MRKANREITSREVLAEVLEASDVCRVAFQGEEYPYIVPLSFGYQYEDGGLSLYFHCAKQGRKLELLAKNPKVGFELDCAHSLRTGEEACQWSMNYRSIIGKGTLSVVTGLEERARGLDLIMSHYGWQGTPVYLPEVLAVTTVLRLDVEYFTGKEHGK